MMKLRTHGRTSGGSTRPHPDNLTRDQHGMAAQTPCSERSTNTCGKLADRSLCARLRCSVDGSANGPPNRHFKLRFKRQTKSTVTILPPPPAVRMLSPAQRPVRIRSRAQLTTADKSSPYLGPSPEPYSSSRAAPRSRSRSAPTLFPRAAWVRPTQIWARPCQRLLSSAGPAFQRASSTSWAAKGRPASTRLRAETNVCAGGSGSSETGSTPALPYGSGRPRASRGRACRGRLEASRSLSPVIAVSALSVPGPYQPSYAQC